MFSVSEERDDRCLLTILYLQLSRRLVHSVMFSWWCDFSRNLPICVWNDLPSDVMSAPSLDVFGRRLKTELFRRCYNAAWLFLTLIVVLEMDFLFRPLYLLRLMMMMMMMMMWLQRWQIGFGCWSSRDERKRRGDRQETRRDWNTTSRNRDNRNWKTNEYTRKNYAGNNARRNYAGDVERLKHDEQKQRQQELENERIYQEELRR